MKIVLGFFVLLMGSDVAVSRFLNLLEILTKTNEVNRSNIKLFYAENKDLLHFIINPPPSCPLGYIQDQNGDCREPFLAEAMTTLSSITPLVTTVFDNNRSEETYSNEDKYPPFENSNL